MGAAWAALHSGYRGNKYEGPGKEAAIAKLNALYKSEGMELPSTNPEGNSKVLSVKDKGCGSDFTLHTSTFASSSPRFVAMLAEPPATGLIRIPIAVTGTWGGAEKKFSIELEDLEQIRENFAKKPTREINVDYEHASEVPFGTGGPVLSAGRIVKFDAPEKFGNRAGARRAVPPESDNGQYILWGWYEPTERARTLIQNREYRYISPAIRWGTKDKVTGKAQGTTLTSVALVNKPFLEEMPEIHLCEVLEKQESGVRSQESGEIPRTFVSLQQLHVPGPVNQVSVAYQQPGSRGTARRAPTDNDKTEENEMAKSLKLKCLTDAHLEKHDLPASHLGKIGVFDGDDLLGVADDGPDGWVKKGNGDGNGDGKKASEVFASEVGMPGKSPAEIAALVKLGIEAASNTATTFNTLWPAVHDGHINLSEAGALADQGKVKFSTIMLAQEAERKVDTAVKAGKILPKNRQHALRIALSDAAAFAALVEEARPVVDLRSHGHAGGGEQPTAQQALMAEVNAYAKENKCSVSVALSEVTKLKPELWREYSEEIVAVAEAAEEED
jgi:phage I-like protein